MYTSHINEARYIMYFNGNHICTHAVKKFIKEFSNLCTLRTILLIYLSAKM